MYLSIWFGIMLAAQSGCTTQKAAKPDKLAIEEARKALPLEEKDKDKAKENPLVKRLNNPSTMPPVPPAGARISYSSVKISQKTLAMTFDDGPHPSLTPKLLDLLKERNIKCTFFLIGQQVKMYPDIVRRIIAEGHEIGNHTWTHCSLTSRSDDQIRSELKKSEDAVFEVAGVRPHLVRPPYGAVNTRIKNLMFTEFGYSTIMWSVDPQDWRRPGVAAVTSRLVNGAHPGAIMLSHDIHPPTITAMPAMFDQLLSQGYQFVTVSQLLNMEKASMPVGVIVRPADKVEEHDPKPLPEKKPSA
ncbi:polysaccharide deacetylase family protein [Prosthecobacter vanneervenii]|uniref:Peptidoglycan/xylan/chitin deacetylase (PgdA/CDA1 family) n=1 Tax=Prosthecobacter vanneervenii TaxID=48466 RepID=A0A7W7YDH4_9BACT|nr:polysaccharide deacetylase family protein [Prosthecobacter vanneervenii]MBB5034017.1 peptidoglycan/xylan/chitin deacetylase (PgdA/CDA1 family) [Prosthecobacter vanneervenii]